MGGKMASYRENFRAPLSFATNNKKMQGKYATVDATIQTGPYEPRGFDEIVGKFLMSL
jgi:hypothetical protein